MKTKTATVRLTVTTFRDLATSLGSIVLCRIGRLVVVNDAGGRVTVRRGRPGTIVVGPAGPVGLRFQVVTRRRNPLRALGILFVQVEGSGDPEGLRNFIRRAVHANTVTVTDTWVSHGTPGCAPAWKFFLAIQDSHGAIGLIDPEVQNED